MSNQKNVDVRNLRNIFHLERGFKTSGWFHFTCPGCGAEVETRYRSQGTCGKPECEMRLLTCHVPEIRVQQLEQAVRKGLAPDRSVLIRDILAAALDAMQDWPAVAALPPAEGEAIVEVKRLRWRKSTQPQTPEARRREIFLHVRNSNGLSSREVTAKTELSNVLVSRYLNELVDQGFLVVRVSGRTETRQKGTKVYYTKKSTAEALGWQKADNDGVAG